MKYQTKKHVIEAWEWDGTLNVLDDLKSRELPYAQYNTTKSDVINLRLVLDRTMVEVQIGEFIVLKGNNWRVETPYDFLEKYECIDEPK